MVGIFKYLLGDIYEFIIPVARATMLHQMIFHIPQKFFANRC